MLSRINSTGRQRIGRDMASFVMVAGASPPTFVASLDLAALEVPSESRVFVEAHRQNAIERFDFGTVASPMSRGSTELRELTAESLQFRVKVVEPGTGKLLALGDRFLPGEAEHGGRQPLLIVLERDLGPEPWRTMVEEDRPALVLNERIPDAIGRLRSDPVFQALVLPAAFRQILLTVWAMRLDADEDSADDDWASNWLRFARQLVEPMPEWADDDETILQWISDVCQAFAARHDFVVALTGGADT